MRCCQGHARLTATRQRIDSPAPFRVRSVKFKRMLKRTGHVAGLVCQRLLGTNSWAFRCDGRPAFASCPAVRAYLLRPRTTNGPPPRRRRRGSSVTLPTNAGTGRRRGFFLTKLEVVQPREDDSHVRDQAPRN